MTDLLRQHLHLLTHAEKRAAEQERGIGLPTVCGVIFMVAAFLVVAYFWGYMDGYERGRAFQKELASREEQCLAGTCVKVGR